MRRLSVFLIVLAALLVVSVPVYAQGGTGYTDGRLNPHSLEMAVYCVSGGVQVWRTGSSRGQFGFHASPEDIGRALALARATRQNVQVAANDSLGVSLWALTSNQLQAIVRTSSVPQYNYIFRANTCGPIPRVTLPAGTTVTPGPTGTTGTTGTTVVGTVYTVRPGDNLFRIGLRYGIHYTELARINHIPNAARIYVGQQIVIPTRR